MGEIAYTREEFQAVLKSLGISRAKYFRLKKDGRLGEGSLIDDHKAYIDAWVSWKDSGIGVRKWSETYRKTQQIYLNKYLSQFPMVTPEYLEKWLRGIPAIQYSLRVDMHASVSSFAKYLHRTGLIDETSLIKIERLYPQKPPEYSPTQLIIDDDDLDTLKTVAIQGHHGFQSLLNTTLLTFLSETGLRVSEACNLTMDRVNFSTNPRQSILRVKGKGGKERVVPFSKLAQKAILDFRQSLKPDLKNERLLLIGFNPRWGYRPLNKDAVQERFSKLRTDTGIPFTAHSLRHYRITKWANDPRIPIAVTQKWAGHASLEVTQRYIHIADDDAMAAAYS